MTPFALPDTKHPTPRLLAPDDCTVPSSASGEESPGLVIGASRTVAESPSLDPLREQLTVAGGSDDVPRLLMFTRAETAYAPGSR